MLPGRLDLFRIDQNTRVSPKSFLMTPLSMELASEMLFHLKIPGEYRVEVIFDSWYLNEKVTKTIELRGWDCHS